MGDDDWIYYFIIIIIIIIGAKINSLFSLHVSKNRGNSYHYFVRANYTVITVITVIKLYYY